MSFFRPLLFFTLGVGASSPSDCNELPKGEAHTIEVAGRVIIVLIAAHSPQATHETPSNSASPSSLFPHMSIVIRMERNSRHVVQTA